MVSRPGVGGLGPLSSADLEAIVNQVRGRAAIRVLPQRNVRGWPLRGSLAAGGARNFDSPFFGPPLPLRFASV